MVENTHQIWLLSLIDCFIEKEKINWKHYWSAGFRLNLNYYRPKVMMPIYNRPLLEFLDLHFSKSGIKKVFINTHYMAMLYCRFCFTN